MCIRDRVTGDHNVQTQKVADTNQVIIKTKTLDLDTREALNQALVENFDVDDSLITAENISSTVSNEMRQDAIIAVIVATIFMLIYICLLYTSESVWQTHTMSMARFMMPMILGVRCSVSG